jgi:putative salt-induced outer membrane protein YdiY
MKSTLRFAVFLFGFVAPAVAFAQAADTQPPAAAPEEKKPPRLEGSAELSLLNSSGNSQTQSLGLGSTVIFRPGVWTTQAQVAFVRSETSDIETAKSLLAWVRQGRALTTTIDVFGRAEYLADEFAGIDSRVMVDAGLGYKPVDNAVHLVRFDAGVGYAKEHRLVGDDLSAALMNLAGMYRWQREKAASFETAGLFTRSFEDSADWRFRHTAAVAAAMSRVLSLKFTHELKYVNAPVFGFEKTDRLLSAAFVAKF